MTTSDHSTINYALSKKSVVCFLSLYYRASQLAGTNFWASEYLRVQFNHGAHHRQFQPLMLSAHAQSPSPTQKTWRCLSHSVPPQQGRRVGCARYLTQRCGSITQQSRVAFFRWTRGTRDAGGLCGREDEHAFTARWHHVIDN